MARKRSAKTPVGSGPTCSRKNGYTISDLHRKQAVASLIDHHATDIPKMQACEYQAAIAQGVQVAMASLGNGKAGGKGGSKAGGGKADGEGKGKGQGDGGKGSGKGKGKGGHGKICQRCGGDDHHQSHCILLTNKVLCQHCHKPGHAASMCKGLHAATGQDIRKCGCCGLTGHIRRVCPTGDTVCTICNLGGHHDYMCYGPQTNKTWADTAAAVAHLPQPPDKPKLLPKGDAGWTFLSTGCDKGIYDPTRTATSCPGCKGKPATGVPFQATPPTSLLGNVSKKTIATERMLAGIGPDGATPKAQEDKQTEDKLTLLSNHVVQLESMKESDFGPQIASWKKEIKELEKTLASP